MSHVAICITTAARPEMLSRCLNSVISAVRSIESRVTLIVVDNDSTGAARPVAQSCDGVIPVIYEMEPRRGIPFGRNRCLSVALSIGADYLVFVDDDMTVAPDWLGQLLLAAQRLGADVVTGEVINVFSNGSEAPKYLVRTGLRLTAETDNVIFKRWIAERLRFDERLAVSGGSDTLFFRQAHGLGAKIHHAISAVAYEHLHGDRGTRSWFLRRNYRYGLVGVDIERLLRRKSVTMRFLARAGVSVALGVFEAVFFLWRADPTRSFGIYRVARGGGMLMGALGNRAKAYF